MCQNEYLVVRFDVTFFSTNSCAMRRGRAVRYLKTEKPQTKSCAMLRLKNTIEWRADGETEGLFRAAGEAQAFCELVVHHGDDTLCSVSALRVVASAKFVECYAAGRYLKTERGARNEDGLFSFDINLDASGGRGGASMFKFLRLNEPGVLLVREQQIDVVATEAGSGNDANTTSRAEVPGMLITMIQMRQQTFEQSIVAMVDRRLATFQGSILSMLDKLDCRLQLLENRSNKIEN